MKKFREKVQKQFNKMCSSGKLFRTFISTDLIWEEYLKSFKPEEDPIFRDTNSTIHNCNNCKNFIRRYGNIVSINENYEISTIFDIEIEGVYKNVAKKLSKLIKDSHVKDVFFENLDMLKKLPYEKCTNNQDFYKLGIHTNHKQYSKEEAELFGIVKENEIRKFEHIGLFLPKKYVKNSTESLATIVSKYNSDKEVFHRAMTEITLDHLILVKDLIIQGSLLNGETYLDKIEEFIKLKREFNKIPNTDIKKQSNWCWVNSYEHPFAKFKNELIGVLCTELSQGMDINTACLNWNKRVDPANYMKAVAPITEFQKKEAQKFVENNGYIESFKRRFATIDDINVNEIKHINEEIGEIKEASIFDSIKTKPSKTKKSKLEKIEEVGIEKFMKEILPNSESIELFLDNNLENNLVVLTTSENTDSKSIFKWNNNFSWTYKGNLAGKSEIKSAVKKLGGNVNGILRFSIMWSKGNSVDNSDLDAHCITPENNKINFRNPKNIKTFGTLDIDIINPSYHKQEHNLPVVENIVFPKIEKLINGDYLFYINQYSASRSEGFSAQIEMNGKIYEYKYNKPLSNKENVKVATVRFENGNFSIKHHIEHSNIEKEIWNLKTNNFHKVILVSNSPNYWGIDNVGNKHYFFMLKDCKPTEKIRTFHNENLNSELVKHRKVLDILGETTKIEPQNKALSGIGFNATVKNEVLLRVKGTFNRLIKVKF